ncbi:hypothetical protein [Salegentibacter chungangensis]|uniref:Lipoprotein n=1 Tax=Salegentibacter chungangensis TaxID=1335724 RepID=A0ABW3NNA2_9FLAO
MKRLLLISGLVIFASCKQEQQQQDISSNLANDNLALEENIEVTNEQVNLMPEAREEAAQWLAYITAQNEISNLRNSTVAEVVENAKPLVQIMQSLQNSVPENLKTTAVEARINVLVTKSQVLQQLATQRELNPEAIAKTAGEIPSDFNNFKLQLNEIYLKTLEDFEKELDELENQEQKDSAQKPRIPKKLSQESELKPVN